jgi:hypothetical protein
MVSLPFNKTSPKAYTLAADGQFSTFKLPDDQVWTITLDQANKHIFHFETTYGLRARSMRLIPHFIDQKQPITNASEFLQPPTITHYTPSTLQIQFILTSGIGIKFDCFMPEPQVLLGAVEIENHSDQETDLTFGLSGILVPMNGGKSIRPEKQGNNHILAGQTGNLYPVLFMTGGPDATGDPYPTLSRALQFSPHETHHLYWALVSKESSKVSYKAARKEATTAWPLEAQQQVMQYAGQTIDIKTGNPDWDSAFYLAQVNAMSHQVASQAETSDPFMIKCRHPDFRFDEMQSPRDKDFLTNLEIAQLSQILLPTRPDILMRLIDKALERLDDAGQRPSLSESEVDGCQIQACPILSKLCLAIFEITGNESFLGRIFPALTRFLFTCLPPQLEDIENHFPLWESPEQLQLDTGLFSFDPWCEHGRGLDIQSVASPALGAMLYQEINALIKIAQILGDGADLHHFIYLEKKLRKIIQNFWQEDHPCFTYLDRLSHQYTLGEWIQRGNIEDTIEIIKDFDQPQRLHLQLIAQDESTRACTIHLQGKNFEGDLFIEKIRVPNLRWVMGKANITTQHLYKALETIAFEGFSPKDTFLVETIDLSQCDITCLLPIGLSCVNKKQCTALIKSLLDENKIPIEYGLPETWQCKWELPQDLPIRVNVMWNSFIIEGLTRAGFLLEAMQLFTNLMSTVVQGLKNYDGFYPLYEADSGLPVGDCNTISALPPMHTFLQIAGIRLFTPNSVAVWGVNPFPWPISIRWQGLSLRKAGSNTQVIFPNGARYEGESKDPILLSSDMTGS